MSADGADYTFADAPSPEALAKFPLNDFGNARRLVRLVGGVIEPDGRVNTRSCQLLYLRERGWIAFNGRYWDLGCGDELARRWAHRVAEGLIAQGAFTAVTGKAWTEFVTRSGNAGASSAMLTQAQSYLGADLADFDTDPLALNLENGVIRFRRHRVTKAPIVEFEPRHDPGDRMTRMCAARWDPKAKRPLFDAHAKFCQPDADTRHYFHKVFGYTATGVTKEQLFVILQGKGGDGKSTLTNAVRETLGSYGISASVETFLDTGLKRAGEASPDLARLAGDTRMISTAEPPRGSKLASSQIKAFTGGAPITARELRQGIFEFSPIGKVVLECNTRPQINDSDDGIWRRTRIILFENQVPKDRIDLDLPDKLKGERSGILNWIAEGVLAWMAEGLKSPPAVLAALEDYRRGSNVFAEWFAERVVLDARERTLSSEFYRSYKEWCEEEGEAKPMNATAFGRALSDLQIVFAGKDRKGKKLRRGGRLKDYRDAPAADGGASDPQVSPGGPSAADRYPDDDWVER